MGLFDKFKKTNNSKIVEDSKNTIGSEVRNFWYLDDLIHSGSKEIVLDSDIKLDKKEKSTYLDGIELDVDDIVIDGNGHTIDAQGKVRIFFCTGKNITIKNITLKEGCSENKKSAYNERGGAIYNDSGEITIIETTFIKNRSNEHGGAIYNFAGKITITESTFTQNNTMLCGGSIHNKNGEITITGSSFTQNTALMSSGQYPIMKVKY